MCRCSACTYDLRFKNVGLTEVEWKDYMMSYRNLAVCIFFSLSSLYVRSVLSNFSFGPRNLAVFVGQRMTMECSACNGSSVLKWMLTRPNSDKKQQIFRKFVDKNILSQSFNHFGFDVDRHGSVFIYSNSTQLSDAGLYFCYIQSETQAQLNAHLIVFDEPICQTNYTTDETATDQKEASSLSGKYVWLQCTVNFTGLWSPTVEWKENCAQDAKEDKSQSPIKENRTVIIYSESVTSTLIAYGEPGQTICFTFKMYFLWQSNTVNVTATNLPDFIYTWHSPIMSFRGETATTPSDLMKPTESTSEESSCTLTNHSIGPSNMAVIVGQRMTMECYACDGSNVLKWMLTRPNSDKKEQIFRKLGDKNILDQDFKHFGFDVDRQGSVFVHSNSTELSDAGLYFCSIQTRQIQNQLNAHLIVFDEPICQTNYTTDEIASDQKETSSLSGKHVLLQCTVNFTGLWSPSVEWTQSCGQDAKEDKTQSPILENRTVIKYSESVTSTLIAYGEPGQTICFTFKMYFLWQNDTVGVTATNLPDFIYTWNSPNMSFRGESQTVPLNVMKATESKSEESSCSLIYGILIGFGTSIVLILLAIFIAVVIKKHLTGCFSNTTAEERQPNSTSNHHCDRNNIGMADR